MRTHARDLLRGAFLAAVALALLALPLPSLAEDVEELAIEDTLTEEQVVMVNRSGAELIQEVGKARAAIAKRDGREARRRVTRARVLLGEVRSVSPVERIQHQLEVTLGKVRQEKAESDDLVPIYAELDAISEKEKVVDVRAHLDRARGHLDAIRPLDRNPGEHWNGAADALIEASASLAYLEIDLPIHETYTLLSRAHLELRHNDLPAADAALADVQQHVEVFVAIASRSRKTMVESVGAGPPE